MLLKSAEELLSYSKGEEKQMEQMVEAIAKAVGPGGVIVSGGKVGDLALHYANRLGLLVVRLNSKFDLRRLCITLGATALPRLVRLCNLLPTLLEPEPFLMLILMLILLDERRTLRPPRRWVTATRCESRSSATLRSLSSNKV